MLAAMLCSVVLAADPDNRTPSAEELRGFRAAEAKAGRDASAHVKLALWCEARGMTAERIKHLALAIMSDPSNAAARGLMGFVQDGDAWRRPEDVAERARSDQAQAAVLDEYAALRDKAA